MLASFARSMPGIYSALRVLKQGAAAAIHIPRLWKTRIQAAKSLSRWTASPSSTRKTAVFFSLHGDPQFLQTQGVIAQTLKQRGFEVLFVGCFRSVPDCVLLDSNRMRSQKVTDFIICSKCSRSTSDWLNRFDHPMLLLTDLVSKETEEKISETVNSLDQLDDFSWDGFALADLALIDLSLTRKLRELKTEDPVLKARLRGYLKSILITYEGVKVLLKKRKVDLLLFNSDYTLNLAALLPAKLAGVAAINVGAVPHLGVDRRRSYFFDDLWEQALFENFLQWKNWRDTRFSEAEISETFKDLYSRLGGTSQATVYSSPITAGQDNLREKYGIPNGKKVLVAYTSSVDEAISTKKALDVFGVEPPVFEQPFQEQVSWLQELKDFVYSRDDLFLFIRIHPREGKRKDELSESAHLQELRKSFSNLRADKCAILWPEDPISSYALAEEADLVLISWSNIGIELARLGTPALASMVRISSVPHDDFIVRVKTKPEYYAKIDEMLRHPPSLATLERAHRWYYLTRFGCTIDMSDIILTADALEPDCYRRELSKAEDVVKIIEKQAKVQDVNLAALKAKNANIPSSMEDDIFRLEIRKMVHFLMTGVVSESKEELSAARLDVSDSVDCKYYFAGKLYSRRSKIVARLKELL